VIVAIICAAVLVVIASTARPAQSLYYLFFIG